MQNKFTILGSGSSLGSPWITKNWGKIKKKNKKNTRSRCCAHIKYKNMSILIDSSPDIKSQFLKNNINKLDAVMYTHEHADQTSGIFELRPFYWMNKKKIPIYGSKRTISELKKKYTFCFQEKDGYRPIMKANIFKNNFKIIKGKYNLKITAFNINHGLIDATGFVFEKIAYLSDCKEVYKKSLKYLYNLDYLIIDCLRINRHPGHLNYDECLKFIKKIKPKKAILTNLHVDFEYESLKKKLPENIIPAYDGLSFNF